MAWTTEEVDILKNNCKNKNIRQLKLLLKNKKESQIRKKCILLDLNIKHVNRNRYRNLYEVFVDYKRLLNGEIKRLIKDYDVNYDILLFKYFLYKNKIEINEDFLYNIKFTEFLKIAKLHSRCKKKWHSSYEFITNCFPKYKLKEYNFTTLQVREGFWLKDYNCFDNIKNGIINAKKDGVIKKDEEIMLLPINVLYKYIHKSMLYFRKFKIIYMYFDFYNIKISSPLWFDNSRFDSKEEVMVYKYIKCDLKLNINKNTVHKFNNKKYNESYVPDFYIEYKCKKIIIEYFGMYRDRSSNDVYTNYKNKTHRKNEYYKSNSNICFIDLYPNDLKNNFAGVRKKLTSSFMQNFNINLKGGESFEEKI